MPKNGQDWLTYAVWGREHSALLSGRADWSTEPFPDSGIVGVKLLGQPIVIINDGDILTEFDRVSHLYSDRPPMQMAGNLVGYAKTLVLMPYSPVRLDASEVRTTHLFLLATDIPFFQETFCAHHGVPSPAQAVPSHGRSQGEGLCPQDARQPNRVGTSIAHVGSFFWINIHSLTYWSGSPAPSYLISRMESQSRRGTIAL